MNVDNYFNDYMIIRVFFEGESQMFNRLLIVPLEVEVEEYQRLLSNKLKDSGVKVTKIMEEENAWSLIK
ncbi:hypothetical protein [Vagococcus intermedius]|uniref:Uncharacterized protein n=1 Tax=Vagococcus intermedius TaxID=2991418 RepID=A0AAF0CVI7_9ENTE|nr:hypothetical protein [Vagococcus intermedius]WEG73646.1 hypothetical protein OL234_01695 [Vagococcus intermedius]WEG75730.1 hypothetical protein OL235_01705 [Vagococcus intermedius]